MEHEPSEIFSSGDLGEGCINSVTSLGRQDHATPNIREKNPGKTLFGKKGVHHGRHTGQTVVTPLRSPTAEGQSSHITAVRTPVTKKAGRKLFPSTSTVGDHAQGSIINSGTVCTDAAQNIGEENILDACGPHPATASKSARGRSRSSGRRSVKHAREPQQTEPTSSEKKSSTKRRRLYSQPIGVIEPDTASDSQKSDGPSTAAWQLPKPADTASRANESVYDLLLEHSVRRLSRGARGGRAPARAAGGRRSAGTRRRRSVTPPPAARTSPRAPRRRAAAAAVDHLRESSSQASGAGSVASGEPPVGSPDPETDVGPREEALSEQLSRGSAEIFYLPTIVPPDDDSGDDEVFEPPAAQDQATDKAGVPDATSRGSSGTSPEYGQSAGDASQSSADTSHQAQYRHATDQPAHSSVSESPHSPPKLFQECRESVRRSSQQSCDYLREVSSGPSWLGSGRRTAKTHRRLQGVACYSHVQPATPTRGLRRHSYLAQTDAEGGERGGKRGGRGQRAPGRRVGRRGAAQTSSPPTPCTARPFFDVDPDSGSDSSAGSRDSVSNYPLLLERAPSGYRRPPCELGPNVSQWSADATDGPRERGTGLSQGAGESRERRPGQTGRAGGPTAESSGAESCGRGGISVPVSLPDEVAPARQPGGAVARRSDPAPAQSSRPGAATGRAGRSPTEKAVPPADRTTPTEPDVDRVAARLERSCSGSRGPSRQLHQPQMTGPVSEQSGTRGDIVLETPPSQDAGLPASDWTTDGPASPPPFVEERETSTGPCPATAGPHPAPAGTHTATAGSHSATAGSHSATAGPHPATAGSHPAPAGPHPATAGPHPATAGSHPAPAGPHPAPAGSHSATAGLHPAPAGPRPATVVPHPAPASPYPAPADSLSGPGTSVGCELARLVVRWRQLARLEQRTLAAMRAALCRQQALVDVQRRLWAGRLQESRQAKAGILACCDVLERL